jgi:hypothetical protein
MTDAVSLPTIGAAYLWGLLALYAVVVVALTARAVRRRRRDAQWDRHVARIAADQAAALRDADQARAAARARYLQPDTLELRARMACARHRHTIADGDLPCPAAYREAQP